MFVLESTVVKFIMSGHDVSDGGLLCAALEMAIAGHVSLKLDFWPDDEYESALYLTKMSRFEVLIP